MKKALFRIVYIVLATVALIVAAGAPIPWSGSGGGGVGIRNEVVGIQIAADVGNAPFSIWVNGR
jgi:hypothetical protein